MNLMHIIVFVLCFVMLTVLRVMHSCKAESPAEREKKIPIKVLILPKFEVADNNFPGEAQYYYEHYLKDAESYEISGGNEGSRLYVRDGVALYLLGMGKVNAALGTMAVLSDERFDFSEAYILDTGCAGTAIEYSVMGDVFIITAAVDYDLGHHVDIRELADSTAPTWFHDPVHDDAAVIRLNPELMDRVYALVKDLHVNTTEKTRKYMRETFDGAKWALREPKVLRGTTATSDNYWKGMYGHEKALKIVETYGCPDPYASTEMEDIAVCTAAKRMGMLDRVIILRVSVNMDVFMKGVTPEKLWGSITSGLHLATEDNVEAADIFATSMKNNFTVGSTIIDAILNGKI